MPCITTAIRKQLRPESDHFAIELTRKHRCDDAHALRRKMIKQMTEVRERASGAVDDQQRRDIGVRRPVVRVHILDVDVHAGCGAVLKDVVLVAPLGVRLATRRDARRLQRVR